MLKAEEADAQPGLRAATIGWVLASLVCLGLLAGCSETQLLIHTAKKVSNDDAAAKGKYKVGNPYQIQGVWYYPGEDYDYDETGIASWYGPNFHGKDTANGESYDQNEITAAHRTLPMPSFVRVTNLENGRSIVVKINDRGPFAHGRILDASRRTAQLLGFEQKGTARVRVQILADESRQIAGKLKNDMMLASAQTPITAAPAPKAMVTSEALLPPPGGSAAPSSMVVAAKPAAPPPPAPERRFEMPNPAVGQVSVGAAKATNIYIQAGAFAQYDNALKVRANLTGVGNVNLSSTLVNGRDIFRVRLGPIADVDQADKLLERVIKAGYGDARIIVD
jgi:rare lipoprotein A